MGANGLVVEMQDVENTRFPWEIDTQGHKGVCHESMLVYPRVTKLIAIN